MKKSLFVLPLVAFALVGCTNSSTTDATSSYEVVDVSEPYANVQPTEMPNTMEQPDGQYQQPTYSQPAYNQTTYSQPTYNQQTSSSYNTSGNAEQVGNCTVVRDGTNTPVYSQIQKGCYTGSTYTVGKYDTLYLISYLSGKSINEIADLNGISSMAKLSVGSTLRLR
ncbi:LysM peptidoglycan-binding domain-containing protein [Lonepinella koalarum]|uniref:LysM peptidoglycan-binding domain-containing protein n=1 Tax=Lonepinella koalarum TaxID=53417 RepID=UPI003F6DE3B0